MGFFNLFYKSHEFKNRLENSRNRLYRVAYSWCHSTHLSDDLVQETLTKALKKGSSLRNSDSMDSWLFTILANTWRSHLRSRKDNVEFNEEYFSDEASPEQLTSRLEMINTVQNAVAHLNTGQRQVITLVDLEGFSYAEVAEILDIPIGTVMSRLCRARQSLKKLISDEKRLHEKNVRLVRVK